MMFGRSLGRIKRSTFGGPRMSGYQIIEADHIYYGADEIAVEINEQDCIVRISRAGDRLAIARAMMELGSRIALAGLAVVPLVDAAT